MVKMYYAQKIGIKKFFYFRSLFYLNDLKIPDRKLSYQTYENPSDRR